MGNAFPREVLVYPAGNMGASKCSLHLKSFSVCLGIQVEHVVFYYLGVFCSTSSQIQFSTW